MSAQTASAPCCWPLRDPRRGHTTERCDPESHRCCRRFGHRRSATPEGQHARRECAIGFSAVLFALKVILNARSPMGSSVFGVSVPTKVRPHLHDICTQHRCNQAFVCQYMCSLHPVALTEARRDISDHPQCGYSSASANIRAPCQQSPSGCLATDKYSVLRSTCAGWSCCSLRS